MQPTPTKQIYDTSTFSDTPLLQRRVVETLRAVRRGAAPLTGDMLDSEERKLSVGERELRTYMDIALNLGIAGTFVSIIVTLGQQQGLDANTLLAHIGPGMTSGLAAVVANVGLRLCHRALQDEQDSLVQHVDDTLAEVLLANIDRQVTSPEDRLAQSATKALQDQNASTHKALLDQSTQFDRLLKDYARQIGSILTTQIQQPIQQIADHAGRLVGHAGALAQHSGTWAETASDLKIAHINFLNTQNEAQEQHEKRLDELFVQYRTGLEEFLQTANQSNSKHIQETHDFTISLLATHTQSLTGMTEHLREQFIALQGEQEISHRRMTEAALASLGNAVEDRLTAIEERIAAVLVALENRLPSTLRDGVRDGLSETVALIDDVREQAAGLTHTITQISGNTDRQLQAYERWAERATDIQGRLEQVVNDGQAAQATLLARWQVEATQTLEGVRAAFNVTAQEAKVSFDEISAAFAPVAATMQRLQSTTQELHNVLAALPSQVAETRVSLSETTLPLQDLVSTCGDIRTVLDTLSASTAVSLERARSVQEDTQRQSQETSHEIMLLTKAVDSAVTQMDRAATAFAVVVEHPSAPVNGHVALVMPLQHNSIAENIGD